MKNSFMDLSNTSTGSVRTFVIEGWPEDDETDMQFLERTHPDIAKIVAIPRIVVEDIEPNVYDTTPDSIEVIKEFVESKNEDVEWDLPKGLLYSDWFDICETIGIEIDWDEIQFDKLQVFVKDQDSFFIDQAIENLHRAGWDLPVHRHVILNGYSSYYEVSE